MTVKQLKKDLHVGRELTVETLRGNMTVRGNSGVAVLPVNPAPRYRRVAKVEGACGEREWSWLRWPKASNLNEIEGGFEVLESGVPILRYKFTEANHETS